MTSKTVDQKYRGHKDILKNESSDLDTNCHLPTETTHISHSQEASFIEQQREKIKYIHMYFITNNIFNTFFMYNLGF